MAAPSLLTINPANNSTGIPVGESIILDFDKGIDLNTANIYIVLYGRDFDQTSGADSVLYIDQDTGDNPFFLKSPGFNGLVELDITATYYDLNDNTEIAVDFIDEADEANYSIAGAGHRLKIKPKIGTFAPDQEYTLHIIGDPDSKGVGLGSRTIFQVTPNPGNASSTGILHAGGSYTGSVIDIVNVEITQSGDIGTAKYKWWLQTEGVGSAIYDKLSNRSFRSLLKGIQIRFTGEDFQAGDTFSFNVEPIQRLTTSTKIVFTTNDGSYSVAPDGVSVPATSEAPSTVIPNVPGASTEEESLQIVNMNPDDGAYNVSVNTKTITITFSELLDPSTIDAESVRIFALPALGWFEGQPNPRELQKRLTVNGETITISF